MRIRQIKPSFWTDAVMSGLPYATRLFYIGLWGQADDAGWMRWDVYRIGCELYGGEPRRARERRIEAWRGQLEVAGRLEPHPCGHAQIPHLAEHQRVGGRAVYTVRDEHARGCARMRADARPGKERVMVSNGKGTDGLKERLGPFEEVIKPKETTP